MSKNKKPPARATSGEFDALHAGLAATFADELERCRKAGVAPSPAFLAQLRQFLSDNGVDTPSYEKRFDRLKESQAEFEDYMKSLDGNVVPINRA